jgi:hypothetical protein
MAKIINPILVNKYGLFASTKARGYSLFSPIQSTSYKDSDFWKFITRPVIDIVLLPVFLFDAALCLVNCALSLLATIHLWTSDSSGQFHVEKTSASREWHETKENFMHAVSAVVAAFINPVLSILALITRPLSSVVYLVGDLCCDRRPHH